MESQKRINPMIMVIHNGIMDVHNYRVYALLGFHRVAPQGSKIRKIDET